MRADVSRDWNSSNLAAVAGVSSRTLQRLFRIFLGKTPHAALRDIRFQCARQTLLTGLADAKVTDLALSCGFPHPGRFAIEYRRRYGEAPSQTLKRQTLFARTLASMNLFVSSNHDRPSISMGPIKADSEHDEIAGGIADELATALTRAGISVTSQHTSARYRLTGAICGSVNQTRLTIRLIDVETGRHLWAHRSDGALGSDIVVDEHLATRIAASLQPCLRSAEIDRAQRKPNDELSPHELTLRAMPHVLSLDTEGNERALDLLKRATDRDPDHVLATALAAWAYAQRVVYHFSATPLEERARSAHLARKALALAGDPTVLAILGNAFTSLHDLDTAEMVVRKALSVDGGSAWAWSRSGWIDVFRGNAESAVERFTIALELAPHDSLAFNNMVGIGCAHFNAGRYRDAAHWQERALLEHPSAIWVHRTLCPAYLLAGAEPEARRSLAALRDHYPELTVADVRQSLPPLPQIARDLVVDALHTVGLPA
jgi:AraC-like DNA-binding protein/tetratricopeptide (TPR) repeat protein